MEQYHIQLGHGSISNMKFAISKRYKWKFMFDDITRYCKVCCKEDPEQVNTNNKVIRSERKNQLWEIDLIGPVQSKGKKHFIFMAIDHYTKQVETKILNNKKASSIIEALDRKYLLNMKTQKRSFLISGKNPQQRKSRKCLLISEQNILTDLPFTIKQRGGIERVNRTFMSKLRKLSNFKRKDWEDQVIKAILAVNLSYHRTLGTSPFIWIYKRLPELEIDNPWEQKEYY